MAKPHPTTTYRMDHMETPHPMTTYRMGRMATVMIPHIQYTIPNLPTAHVFAR